MTRLVKRAGVLRVLFPLHLGEAIGPLSRVGLDRYSLLMVGLLTCDLGWPLNERLTDGQVVPSSRPDLLAAFADGAIQVKPSTTQPVEAAVYSRPLTDLPEPSRAS